MKKKLSQWMILCVLILCSCAAAGCSDATNNKKETQVKKEISVENLSGGIYNTDFQMLENWDTMLRYGTIQVENGSKLSDFDSKYDDCILVIDNSITEIGHNAFCHCTDLREVVIPESVTTIGEYAFYDCSMLETVYGGNGVTEIGEYAFASCMTLKDLEIPELVSIIRSGAFKECRNLENIVIPDGVTTIEQDAFHGCKHLEKIIIPDNTTEIGEKAFAICNAMMTLELPNSLKSIGKEAFLDVNNIEYTGKLTDKDNWGAKTVNGYVDGNAVYEDETKKKLTGVSTMTKEFEIPDSVTEIGPYAFVDCNKIKSLTIPINVKSIGQSAFLYVNNIVYTGKLTDKDNWGAKTQNGYVDGDVVYENKDKKKLTGVSAVLKGTFEISDGVTEIGPFAFYECEDLEMVKIPNGVETIGALAFMYCNKLESVTIPNSVKAIGKSAFSDCGALESVTLPNKLETIEEQLFCMCGNLKDITIPQSVNEIKDHAFFACFQIENLVVPKTVTQIGYYAFGGVTDSEITYNGAAVDHYEDSNGRWGAE